MWTIELTYKNWHKSTRVNSQYRQTWSRGQNKQMRMLRRPKPSARADKSSPNNAQSLSDIILGLNEDHNKRWPFSLI
jgi:hypothetical protein